MSTPADDGKRWGTPLSIDPTPAAFSERPAVALNAAGDGVAIWEAGFANIELQDIRASEFEPSIGWAMPQRIVDEASGQKISGQSSLTIDDTGDAFVVWRESSGAGAPSNVWANRYSGGDGRWEAPTPIETDEEGSAFDPHVAGDMEGGAIACWSELREGQSNVRYARYTADQGWLPPDAVETDESDASTPQVAIGGNGTAVFVWRRDSGGGRSTVWSRQLTPAGEWRALQPISDDTADVALPQVGTDADGNAIALWGQTASDSRSSVWSSRFDAERQRWGDPERLDEEPIASGTSPRLAASAGGAAVVAWAQSDGSGPTLIARSFVRSGGWSDSVEVGRLSDSLTSDFDVAIGSEGDVLAVWVQGGPALGTVVGARSLEAGVWGEPEPIGDEGRVNSPSAALDANGDGLAIWISEPEVLINRLE